MLSTKVIHQTWKTNALPAPYADFANSIQVHHPHYEYRLWTDEDNRGLIRDTYPWFLPTYDAYKHEIERVDAVRYFLLYTYGGVYIDLDMECLKPLDRLFSGDEELYFSLEAGPLIDNQVVSNAFMASDPGNRFFYEIMIRLESFRKRDIVFADVFNNTGPVMLTRQCAIYRSRFAIRIIGLDDICPRKVIDQHPKLRRYDLADIRDNRRLYLIHHNTESWNRQAAPPQKAPDGYDLYRSHDINGCDIDYVECMDNDLSEIKRQCDENPDAVGFNYNGFIKGAGGRLEKTGNDGTWMKHGKIPWVCVKKSKSRLSRPE